jgi:hypothetical protein
MVFGFLSSVSGFAEDRGGFEGGSGGWIRGFMRREAWEMKCLGESRGEGVVLDEGQVSW